jgi:hypothetical protein
LWKMNVLQLFTLITESLVHPLKRFINLIFFLINFKLLVVKQYMKNNNCYKSTYCIYDTSECFLKAKELIFVNTELVLKLEKSPKVS